LCILAPLGFDLVEAANGQECLDIYQQIKPDVILIDLAMPVMDGWEAAYIIRKVHQSSIPIAIISANAFDKNLENAAGISAHDFIVKPVNVEDLLDWLGQSLNIEWITKDSSLLSYVIEPESLEQARLMIPSEAVLNELLEMINLGYVKGIHKKLDEIVEDDNSYLAFTDKVRQFANQFQLEAMKDYMQEIQT
jgi:CheY-like chemotaxis protein